jgi:uncharacterized membrane protein
MVAMYDIALAAHFAGMVLALIFIIRADHSAFSWVRGKTPTLDPAKVRYYHRGVWAALIVLILSGAYLAFPLAEWLVVENRMFQAKLLFVLALVMNSFMIGSLGHIATTKTFAELSTRERLPLFIAGAISITCWLGSFAAGLMLFPGSTLFGFLLS